MKKGMKSPYAAYVCTAPEITEADSEMLSCRADMSIDNVHDSVPSPAHSGFLAAVSRGKKGSKGSA